MKHQLVTAAVALLTVGIAFAPGAVYRKPALMGATTSGLAALGSILAMGAVRGAGRRSRCSERSP